MATLETDAIMCRCWGAWNCTKEHEILLKNENKDKINLNKCKNNVERHAYRFVSFIQGTEEMTVFEEMNIIKKYENWSIQLGHDIFQNSQQTT